MGLTALLPTVLAIAAIVAALRYANAPHTVVALADGRARVLRGSPPARLVHDLDDVARAAPTVNGRVTLRGRGETLRLGFRGLAEPMEQRVRNVVLLHRDRLG